MRLANFLEKEIKVLSDRLSNSSFVKKAPVAVVDECNSKLVEAKSQAELVRKRLGGLS